MTIPADNLARSLEVVNESFKEVIAQRDRLQGVVERMTADAEGMRQQMRGIRADRDGITLSRDNIRADRDRLRVELARVTPTDSGKAAPDAKPAEAGWVEVERWRVNGLEDFEGTREEAAEAASWYEPPGSIRLVETIRVPIVGGKP